MTSAIQILPPVTQSPGEGPRTARALVPVTGPRAGSARMPLFSHVGARGVPATSPGFLAQHLAQEWMGSDAAAAPAHAAAAYATRPAAATAGFAATA